MWLKGFLLVIFLCSYIGYGETSPKKCYCGYIEFEISDNDGQSKAKPPVHCTQEMYMYDSKPLHGKCYRTYEHKSCKDPSMNCENGVSSILTVHFNKFDGYDRSLDTAANKTGSVAISDDVFSITVKCSHSINCSINVPYRDLMFQSGSYQQFLDKIAFVSKQTGRSEEKFNNQTSIQGIRHGKTLQSANEDQNDPTQEWNPDFTTILYKPKSKKKSAFRMELKSGSQECYCGSLRIPILKKNASLSKAGNPWQCRNGQGNYDSSPQQGRCYVTFKYYKCVEHECTEEVEFYLNVYYNKLDEVPDALKNNQTIRGHFNHNTDGSFDFTLYCEGDKCEVDPEEQKANVSVNGNKNIEFARAMALLKNLKNQLQNKPEAMPIPSTTAPPAFTEVANAKNCYCGHFRYEAAVGQSVSLTTVLSENCTMSTGDFDPKARNKRCYMTIESDRCSSSKRNCSKESHYVVDVYFNNFGNYDKTLDSMPNHFGIVNNFVDEYTFSITLTCGQDFCTPNETYISTSLLVSNLSTTALGKLKSSMVILMKKVSSEQKPVMEFLSTTPLYNGYHYLDESVEPTTKSDTGLGTGAWVGIGIGCLILVAIANFVFILVTKRILKKAVKKKRPRPRMPQTHRMLK